MEKTPAEIEAEYAALQINFKPEFGNKLHIDVARDSEAIVKLEKELSKKVKASKGAETLRAEIIQKKKNVLFWMKGA